MSTLTQARAPLAGLLSEASGSRSRGNLAIAASMAIVALMVLGKVAVNEGAVTVGTPVFAGTGNGAMTKASPAYGAGVQEGTYSVELVQTGTDAGKFQVIRPDGTTDGFAEVGTAYDGQVKFTIADGGTDFGADAKFTLAVTIAAATDEGQYKALDLSATDGAERAAAVALYPVTTGVGETAEIAGIVRDAEVIGDALKWPAGITSDQKAEQIAYLADLGIIVR